jgi:membrane-associated phospholipid phosphatase
MTRPWVRWLLASALLIGAAHALDPFAWRALRLPTVYEKDWGRLLRSIGYLPTWGAVALAFWLQERDHPTAARRAAFLVLAPTMGGALAELLKLAFRRLRPDDVAFGYAFRPYADQFWSNRGMGLPSSHALVAFAAAAALGTLFPRARWLFYTLAAGCGLTRVLAHAHFLSDVAVAASVGIGATWWLARRWLPAADFPPMVAGSRKNS